VQVLAYTNWRLEGIYALHFDTETCAAIPVGRVSWARNATFFAVHPNQRFLFAVNQLTYYRGEKGGAVSAYAIDRRTGALEHLNSVPSGGVEPCFISVDGEGRNVLVANYMSGSVAVLPIAADGRLRPASALARHPDSSAESEGKSLTHSVNAAPQGRFVVAANLGMDELLVYKFDAECGTLTPGSPPSFKCQAGAGPRHFVFHSNGRFAYVVNERRSEVTSLAWDSARGAFGQSQTVATVPEGFAGKNHPSEIGLHPGGRFLYAANRGHDSIAVFAIDAEGRLTALDYVPTGGACPRGFGIDPSGDFLFAANQKSNNVVVFRIDQQTGLLHSTGKVLEVESPVCVRFVRNT
jgi:6-phosphogluconolactonase